jgi:hypothetical protein
MDKERYIDYSVEELLEDQEFVRIVKTLSTNDEWEQFFQSQTASGSNILRAREIIRLFEVTDGKLQEEKKYKLWKSISMYNKEFKRTVSLSKMKIVAKVAASVLILLSLGALWYLGLKNSDEYQFVQNVKNSDSENPVLVLSNGKKFELEKNDSKIAVLEEQNAILINDSNIVKNQILTGTITEEMKYNEVIVPFAKKLELVLVDGTKVWLNAGSRFAFPQNFEGKRRKVFLEGEAYLEVAKNENQPFIVNTNSVNVEVLGTKFNVSAYSSDDFCETVLLEGSVNIWGKDKLFRNKILMAPKQKATFSKENNDIVLENEPATAMYIAWIDGWYQFSNENLRQVLNKLERYYNVKFQYDQALITKALPVSGKLDVKESLNEVMLVLSRVAKINYQISGKNVILKE